MSTNLVFGSKPSRGNSFERVHQLRELYSRRVLDQKVNVVVLTVHFCQRCAKVLTHVAKDGSQVI